MKIRLTVISGGVEGARVKVKTSPFVIGRDEGCDLVLQSRSISRRHCALIHHAKRFMVQDLGSRNHTIVGDRVLKEGQACRLWHHDELQIGKVRFRVSLRHKETNEPITEQAGASGIVQLSSILKIQNAKATDASAAKKSNAVEIANDLAAEDLLNELDSLVDQNQLVEVLHVSALERDPAKTLTNAEKASSSAEDSSDTHPEVSKTHQLTHHGMVLDRETNDDSNDSQMSEEPANGPKKLPDHLRPKGPADSQDAATEALRRMFSGGR